MLYFGYTNCPDVCPATLANLTGMLGKVKSKDVRVLFVTVDPDRDTPAGAEAICHAFSPQIEGLRGSDNQLADLARRYRVAYSVDPETALYGNAFQRGVLLRPRRPRSAGHHRHRRHGRHGGRCAKLLP